MLFSISSQAKTLTITKQSCKVSIELAEQVMSRIDKGESTYQIMAWLDNKSRAVKKDSIYVGYLMVKLNVSNIRLNKKKGFSNGKLIDQMSVTCVDSIGIKFKTE